MCNEVDLAGIHDLMRVTDRETLGRGRDVKEAGAYNDLEVKHVWKISKPTKDLIYNAKKAEALMELQAIQASGQTVRETHTLLSKRGIITTDSSVNEQILLTGTKPELVASILQNGVDPRFCRGLFGLGAYFAEAPAKVDQYCTADDPASEDANMMSLHKCLYNDCGLWHPGKVFYCFVVRSIVGAAIHTRDGDHNMSPPFDSIWATQDRRQLVQVPGTKGLVHYHTLVAEVGGKIHRHREFILFDRDRAKLEYLVAYQRVQRR